MPSAVLESQRILLNNMACVLKEYIYWICVLFMEMCWEEYFL